MESKTKNKKSFDQLARMVERAFNGITIAAGEGAVRELKEGWFNVAYDIRLSDGREIILKIAPPKDAEVMIYEKNIMTTEVDSMRLVAQNPAIPVPEIYYFDTQQDVCDSDYFFMEKLKGDNLEQVRESLSRENRAQINRQIGQIIHAVNGFTGTYFGYDGNPDLRGDTWKETFIKIVEAVLEDGARKNAEYGFEAREIREVMMKHAAALDSVTTPQLVHWDAWNSNFFVQNGKISGILDFERALWGDPLMESQFRELFFEGGISESMRGYGKITFTPAEDERCHLYTLYLALVMKTECYYRDYDTDEVSNISKMMMEPTMRWLREN